MEDCIEKEGIIDSVREGKIVVRFYRRSACAECHAKQSCTTIDEQEKLMEFSSPVGIDYKIGEKVHIQTTRLSMKRAIFLAFILPLMLLVGSLSLPHFTAIDQSVSYWITSFVIIAYYVLLYFLKSRLDHLIPVQIVKSDIVNQIN